MIILAVVAWMFEHARDGWEDEDGFHEGTPGQVPVTGRRRE